MACRSGWWATVSLLAALNALPAAAAFAQSRATPSNPCPRLDPGSIVTDPPSLASVNGVLALDFNYNTETDSLGRTLYCFTTNKGVESPTLWLNPGDKLVIHVKNNLPPTGPPPDASRVMDSSPTTLCGATTMMSSSVNMHFHGTNTSPTCHSDEVIHTLINPGDDFTYKLAFPLNEPPGLYWYHPHVHGISETAVQGGATGAIVVNGLPRFQKAVRGLQQRIFVIRDENLANPPVNTDPNAPSWDISLNYVPVPYPDYPPAIIQMKAGKQELWRVVNASADTIIDLQLQYDGTPQTLQIVGLDGVPTGSQDGTQKGTIVDQNDILMPPASRAEFIVTPPDLTVQNATLLTLGLDTGPEGDSTPQRPIASIVTVDKSKTPKGQTTPEAMPSPAVLEAQAKIPQRFEGLAQATPTVERQLYFSETTPDGDPDDLQSFFITVFGQSPVVFNPNNPPAIITTQGSVEDWTIQNRSMEPHEFHLHQTHFLVMAENGVALPADQQQFHDMYQVPYWQGDGNPYPSITIRIDFRGPDVGDFVYHCHILGHEDNGMMAIIRVEPSSTAAALDRLRFGFDSLVEWFYPHEMAPRPKWCVRGQRSDRPPELLSQRQ